MNEHGFCPNCKMDFDGELIFETFLRKYGDRRKAIETAEMYGATETKGRWGKRIGIYSIEKDRTSMWRCPDCNHTWSR